MKDPTMVAKPVTILYVEGKNSLSRQLVADLLSSNQDLMLVGCAESDEETLDFCGTLNPNIVLMEVISPEASHVDAVRVIRSNYPNIKVVILSQSEDIDMVRAMLRVGITGYLTDYLDLPSLAASIQAINSGAVVVSSSIVRPLFHASLNS